MSNFYIPRPPCVSFLFISKFYPICLKFLIIFNLGLFANPGQSSMDDPSFWLFCVVYWTPLLCAPLRFGTLPHLVGNATEHLATHHYAHTPTTHAQLYIHSNIMQTMQTPTTAFYPYQVRLLHNASLYKWRAHPFIHSLNIPWFPNLILYAVWKAIKVLYYTVAIWSSNPNNIIIFQRTKDHNYWAGSENRFRCP